MRRSRASCAGQEIELPSWAFGNSGTRFKVFAQPGVPRDPYEKIADAAQVHEYTGVAPRVSLHIPWDEYPEVQLDHRAVGLPEQSIAGLPLARGPRAGRPGPGRPAGRREGRPGAGCVTFVLILVRAGADYAIRGPLFLRSCR